MPTVIGSHLIAENDGLPACVSGYHLLLGLNRALLPSPSAHTKKTRKGNTVIWTAFPATDMAEREAGFSTPRITSKDKWCSENYLRAYLYLKRTGFFVILRLGHMISTPEVLSQVLLFGEILLLINDLGLEDPAMNMALLFF